MSVFSNFFKNFKTDYTIETISFKSFDDFWKSKLFYNLYEFFEFTKFEHYLTSYGLEFITVKREFQNLNEVNIGGDIFVRIDEEKLLPKTLEEKDKISCVLFYKDNKILERELQKIENERIEEAIRQEREAIFNKAEFKRKTKSEINKKFVIGKEYSLRFRPNKSSKYIVKSYICKKFIYTMRDTVLNAIIVKQVSGPSEMIFTLNKDDCKRLHIKYEDGLQILSMKLDWIEKTKK